MNKLQTMALENPALLAIETAHPRFTHQYAWGVVRITINRGYE